MNNQTVMSQEKRFDVKIRKSTLEWGVIIGLMIFSLVNNVTLLLALILSLFLLRQKEAGAIKILNLITLRTIINPGLGVEIDKYQSIKWIIIFLCSFYLLGSYFKMSGNQRKYIRSIKNLIILFTIYNAISSFVFSTLPTVAMFKLLSYVIVFLGVFVGINYTSNNFDCLLWLYKLFAIIIFASIPLVSKPVGYLRNGHGFQGITNQPNMLGIVLVLFISFILTNIQTGKIKSKVSAYLLLSISIYMIILSKSRTSLIACVILLIIYIVLAKMNKLIKLMSINLISAILILYLSLDNSIIAYFLDFIYKGQNNILYSRFMQIDSMILNFMKNPWFGSGFAVPITPYRTFSFSTEYVVEPGNLILSVLSYSGILGFFIFSGYILNIFWVARKNIKEKILLLIAPMLISMGEMVFFSSNNIGIWCYMMISLYTSVVNDN